MEPTLDSSRNDLKNFDTELELICDALDAECGVAREDVQLQTDLLNDIQVDSLDMLNASFRIEQACGVKIPIDEWILKEYGERAENRGFFVVERICEFIKKHRE